MSKNIEINIATSDNTYDVLYPVTNYNILLNKPTIPTVPSLPLFVTNGGTGVTSYSALATKLSSYLSTGAKMVDGTYTGTGVNTVTISFSTISGMTARALIITPLPFVSGATTASNSKNGTMLCNYPIVYTKTTTKCNGSGYYLTTNSDLGSWGYTWMIDSFNNSSFTLKNLTGVPVLNVNNNEYSYIVFFY